MTVESLETAKEIVRKSSGTVAAIYEYHHAITGKKFWSIESHVNKGVTLRSGYVISPRLIYSEEEGWKE